MQLIQGIYHITASVITDESCMVITRPLRDVVYHASKTFVNLCLLPCREGAYVVAAGM